MSTQDKKQAGPAKGSDPEMVDFVVEFRKYKTTLNRKFLERQKWERRDERIIKSFIPGLITRIFVKEGDEVEAGQQLLVLEAMKMNNVVYAESAAVIRKVHVSEMEKVPKNKVIFELDPLEG